MKRLWRVGAFGWFGVALLVPVLLAQVAEQNIGIEIGKAASAKAQIDRAFGRHFEEGDYPGAIAAYEEVVELFPASDEAPEALFRVGNIHHWQLVDPDEAIASYQRVIDEYPASARAKEAWIRIGEAHGRHKRWDDALVAFQEAVDRHPGTEYAGWALLKIGHTHYIDRQDRETGRPFLKQVVNEHPGTTHAAEARLRLTRMDYEDGALSPEQAIAAFENVAASAMGDPVLETDALHMVAMVLTVERRYEESLVVLNRIVNDYAGVSVDSQMIAHHLQVVCYRQLGDHSTAVQTAEQALQVLPTSRWRGRVQAQLSSMRNRATEGNALNE